MDAMFPLGLLALLCVDIWVNRLIKAFAATDQPTPKESE